MSETKMTLKEIRAEVDKIEEARLQVRLTQLHSLSATQRVLLDVEWERDKQNQQWGGNEHDDQHGPRDWAAFITEHLGKALDEADHGNVRYRSRMVEVAALAVAAVETYDREVPRA